MGEQHQEMDRIQLGLLNSETNYVQSVKPSLLRWHLMMIVMMVIEHIFKEQHIFKELHPSDIQHPRFADNKEL